MQKRKRPLPIYYNSRLLFNLMLFFLGGRLKVFGSHHLPEDGAYLLVSNHMSIADSPIVLMALPPMTINFWIADKWRNLFFFGLLASRIGGIFIDRSGVDRKAIRKAVNLLKSGQVVGLAPEATRSPIGQLIRPKRGAAYLASQSKCRVVPVGIIGSDKLFGNFLRFRRTNIEVRFGEPFELPAVTGRVRSAELDSYTDYIMLHIARLLPKTMHGFYAHTEHRGLAAILRGEDPWRYCYEQKEKR